MSKLYIFNFLNNYANFLIIRYRSFFSFPLLLLISMNTANLLKILNNPYMPLFSEKRDQTPHPHYSFQWLNTSHIITFTTNCLTNIFILSLSLLPSFLQNIKIFHLVTYFFSLSLFFLFDIDCNKANLFFVFLCCFFSTSWLSWPIYNFAYIICFFSQYTLFQHQLT